MKRWMTKIYVISSTKQFSNYLRVESRLKELPKYPVLKSMELINFVSKNQLIQPKPKQC